MRLLTIALVVGATTAPVAAQPSDNTTLAEQLFAQGRELAKNNDWAAACPKFEASLRYDPAIGTQLNLATCYDKVGKVASAWGQYRDAADRASKSGDTKRKDYALLQAKALEPRLPRLTIIAPASAPTDFTVTRDNQRVDAALLGSSFYVDPGAHQIAVSASGFEPYTTSVTVGEGKTETVKLPDLVKQKVDTTVKDNPDTSTISRPNPDTSTQPPPQRDVAPSSGRWTMQRKLALGVGIGGVVLVGGGVVFGVKARSTNNDVKSICGDDHVCDSQADFDRAHGLVSDARTQSTISTVLTIAGAAAIVGGGVLWFLAPSASHDELAVTPVVTTSHAGLAVTGSF